MDEFDLPRGLYYLIHPRDSKIYSDKWFVFIDNGFRGGSHWCCSIVKDNKSYYFDLFGGQPDKFLLNQKHIIFIKYKISIQKYVELIVYIFSVYLKE